VCREIIRECPLNFTVKCVVSSYRLPLVQSRQKFSAMDLVLRQEFHSMIAKLADKYQLNDIVFASFVLQYGFRSRYCAADVVYAMLANLESTVSCILCSVVLFPYLLCCFYKSWCGHGKCSCYKHCPITLVNKILAHERFIVFLTQLFTLNPNMQSRFFHHPQFLYNGLFNY